MTLRRTPNPAPAIPRPGLRETQRPLPIGALRRLARMRSRVMMERLVTPHPPAVQRLVARWNRPDGLDPCGGGPPSP